MVAITNDSSFHNNSMAYYDDYEDQGYAKLSSFTMNENQSLVYKSIGSYYNN